MGRSDWSGLTRSITLMVPRGEANFSSVVWREITNVVRATQNLEVNLGTAQMVID